MVCLYSFVPCLQDLYLILLQRLELSRRDFIVCYLAGQARTKLVAVGLIWADIESWAIMSWNDTIFVVSVRFDPDSCEISLRSLRFASTLFLLSQSRGSSWAFAIRPDSASLSLTNPKKNDFLPFHCFPAHAQLPGGCSLFWPTCSLSHDGWVACGQMSQGLLLWLLRARVMWHCQCQCAAGTQPLPPHGGPGAVPLLRGVDKIG